MDAKDEAGRAPTILAIDDDADALAILVHGLTAHGFKVQVAGDGEEGLRLALADPPDMVITDACMPEMDGPELIARLRADPATVDVPAIVLTAGGRDPVLVARGFEAGADDYLLKPVRMEELAVRVEALLRRRDVGRRAGGRLALVGALLDDARAALAGIAATTGTGEALARARRAVEAASRLADPRRPAP